MVPISYYYTETSSVISSRQHFRHDSQESQLNSFLSVDKQKGQELYWTLNVEAFWSLSLSMNIIFLSKSFNLMWKNISWQKFHVEFPFIFSRFPDSIDLLHI